MTVIGIDPGPIESAYVMWDGSAVLDKGDVDNDVFRRLLQKDEWTDHCAIEQIRGFGVMASDALFDTCWWTGRFFDAFGEHRTTMVPRKEAAKHICGVGGISKDQFVREAIIARFGGKERAIGSKKSPGPLYGISGHKWAALAVALTWHDLNCGAVLKAEERG